MPNRHAVTSASEHVGRPWKPVLALGFLTAVVGVVLIVFPVVAAFALNLVIGVTLVVAGAERLIESRRPGNRALGLFLGVAGVVLGVLALLAPRLTLTVLVAVVGWSLLLTGVAGPATPWRCGARRRRRGVSGPGRLTSSSIDRLSTASMYRRHQRKLPLGATAGSSPGRRLNRHS
jgi:uncharacterized membrane protein HdeD (DUF308 family)